jgi:two-component system, NarL family, response regulator YdfI
MQESVIRVLISAASERMRVDLQSMLEQNSDLKIAGTIVGLVTLEHHIRELHPDVLLIELEGAQIENLSFVNKIRGPGPNLPIVLLIDNVNEKSIARATRVGVRSVLMRDAKPEQILIAIKGAVEGLTILPADILRKLFGETPARPLSSPPLLYQPLTSREMEVLRMLAQGLANKEIAAALSISAHTVKFHITSIFSKLNVSTRTEAVTAGLRLGYIAL